MIITKKRALGLTVLSLFLMCFFSFFLGKSVWDGKKRVTMAVSKADGGASLIVFDPSDFLITEVYIPPNTMINVSHGMGDWPLRSVWKLGYQEGYGGEFFRTSLMKSFRVPIDLWTEEETHKTNMSIKDRLLLGVFSMRVNSGSKTLVDIRDLGFLEKSTVGGDEVYLVKGTVPDKLLSLFVLREMLGRDVLVSVFDNSSEGLDEGKLVGIIEHLGTKVVSFERGETDNGLDCVVKAGDKLVLKELSRLFLCKTEFSQNGGENVEFRFGENFARRW